LTIAAFFITFVAVLILLYFLGKAVTKLAESLPLGFVNKILGAVFEGIKMLLIISVFLNLFQKINFNNLIVSKEKLDESVFYESIEKVSKEIFPLMEEWYKIALSEASENIEAMKENKNSTSF